MKPFFCLMPALLLVAGPCAAAAQEKPDEKHAEASKKPEKSEKGEKAEKAEPPKPEKSVSQHSAVIGGTTVGYTATAGTLIVRNEKDEPWASIGYVAYVKQGADPGRRPITFAYNGGPGSSSVWLHMGALGPKRVVVADAAPTPPPP